MFHQTKLAIHTGRSLQDCLVTLFQNIRFSSFLSPSSWKGTELSPPPPVTPCTQTTRRTPSLTRVSWLAQDQRCRFLMLRVADGRSAGEKKLAWPKEPPRKNRFQTGGFTVSLLLFLPTLGHCFLRS